ncbi:thymidylate synthase [Spongiactinospora rosea]|uniref:thymidylate synthase n=1 Tax=Spongiactinospora rosea TaxID=2248750 RepID=UPI001CEC9834|nr:thymidylate synthase [Spongiactinospora rosea]
MPNPDIQAGIRQWKSCGEAWVWLLDHVWATGRPAEDDRGPIIEAPAVLFEIEDVRWDDPVVAAYGDRRLIPLYTRKFTRRAVIPPFKYSYGARLRGLQGVDQLAWVIDLLRARPYSKSGWLSLTTPGEPFDAVPCLSGLAFRVRAGRLVATAAFRSQNAYTSYLNYLPLRDVQAGVAQRLRLPCGPLRIFVDVPHIYLADTEAVAAVLREVSELRQAS